MAERPITSATAQTPEFTKLNDLVSAKIGGKIIFATDDWFATAENLLKTDVAVFDPSAFTDYGKLMDGWESRRKRIPGHDWCMIQLGSPGIIHGVDIDTSFFTGNYAPKASIQGASLDHGPPGRQGDRMGQGENADERKLVEALKSQDWTDIVPMTVMKPGYKDSCHNYIPVQSDQRWTHIRLNIYPDGGVARLRVFGQVIPDWSKIPANDTIDLAAMLHGGIYIDSSNAHFGHGRNMIGPGRSAIMADGWETARRLDRPAILTADANGVLHVPGSEWCVLKLGHPGTISKVEVDTDHFKGNFPDSCWIEATLCSDHKVKVADGKWQTLLPVTKLSAHKQHYYEGGDVRDCGVVSHVRVSMAPDGGISRVRLLGKRETPAG